MRVNIYAEEMTNEVEIISKELEGGTYTAVRFYLHLPVTYQSYAKDMCGDNIGNGETRQMKGPFIHHPGDDDSSAVTFWGKKDLRALLVKAIEKLDEHHASKGGAK